MPRNPREFSRSRTAPPDQAPAASHPGKAPPQQPEPQSGYAASFAARFGRVILQHGVAAIPSALYHFQGRLGLTAQQVWFVSYILAHKWAEALPHPSLNRMARCTGVERRVLQYRCAELTNIGLLKIQPRYGDKGDQDTNYFDFSGLFEQLEGILLDEPAVPNPIRDAEGRENSASRVGQPGTREQRTGVRAIKTFTNGADLDYSFLARYGRVLLRYGIATVPKALFTHQAILKLTPQQVWFVCYILSFQWDASLPYPSINKMAERTGYSKRQLLRIKDELVGMSYLEVVHRTSSDRGNDTNAYDFSQLFEAIRRQLQASEESDGEIVVKEDKSSGVMNRDVEEPNSPDEDAEDTKLSATRRHRARPPQPRSRGGTGDGTSKIMQVTFEDRTIEQDVTRRIASEGTWGIEQNVIGPVEHNGTTPVAPYVASEVTSSTRATWQTRSPGGQKPMSPKIETRNIEPSHEDDSNQRSQKNKAEIQRNDPTTDAYSPYIAGVASDFSRELGDSIHEASNIKQALHLWRGSGLGEQQFVVLMQEARKLTRRYQNRPTWDTMNNKMAYYFATLRDLVARATES